MNLSPEDHQRVLREIVARALKPKLACEDCGKVADLRPYGPGGSNVCFICGMKDPENAEFQFNKSVTELLQSKAKPLPSSPDPMPPLMREWIEHSRTAHSTGGPIIRPQRDCAACATFETLIKLDGGL